jgi:hypothetical protein
MIYIFTALYHEAKPFIAMLGLKKDSSTTLFQNFFNDNYNLTVTGPGSIAAAIAVSAICATRKMNEDDYIINIGTCASKEDEEVYIGNKIIEEPTGRTFYPDILYKHPFRETTIVSSSKILSSEEIKPGQIYDMEAAGIYQAALYYFHQNKILFIKIRSDAGLTSNKISPQELENIVSQSLEDIIGFMAHLHTSHSNAISHIKEEDFDSYMQQISKDLHCSMTMQNQLRQYITYAQLTHIPYRRIITHYYECGDLPCNNKNEGKITMQSMMKDLISNSHNGKC